MDISPRVFDIVRFLLVYPELKLSRFIMKVYCVGYTEKGMEDVVVAIAVVLAHQCRALQSRDERRVVPRVANEFLDGFGAGPDDDIAHPADVTGRTYVDQPRPCHDFTVSEARILVVGEGPTARTSEKRTEAQEGARDTCARARQHVRILTMGPNVTESGAAEERRSPSSM